MILLDTRDVIGQRQSRAIEDRDLVTARERVTDLRGTDEARAAKDEDAARAR